MAEDVAGKNLKRRVKCRCGQASLEVPSNLSVRDVICTQCDAGSASGITNMEGA